MDNSKVNSFLILSKTNKTY